jgi:hypothetical protein
VAERVVDLYLAFDTELKKIVAPLGRSTTLPIGMSDALGISDTTRPNGSRSNMWSNFNERPALDGLHGNFGINRRSYMSSENTKRSIRIISFPAKG